MSPFLQGGGGTKGGGGCTWLGIPYHLSRFEGTKTKPQKGTALFLASYFELEPMISYLKDRPGFCLV